ncbi:MAG TPA: hypothetical protein VKX16_03450 [Chloroflexota bacterium]|nr:hypothetical protein [Chloroflexota bacterium]
MDWAEERPGTQIWIYRAVRLHLDRLALAVALASIAALAVIH